MRSSALLILATFVADATAYYNFTFPTGFNLGLVKSSDLQQWCLAETNTCPMVCGGSTSQNDCDATTLDFDCTCFNGSVPDLTPYQNTIPFFVCEENYKQCINNNPQDLTAQKQCKANATCGTILLTADASTTTSASSTSAAASTTAASNSAATTMASSAAATSPSGSGSGAAATASASHGAAALQVSSDRATGFFAAAMVAVFGLLM